MAGGFDTVKASSDLKSMLKMDLTPQAAAVDLKKKNNRSANTRMKEDSHGSLQPQSKKYSDKSLDKLTNKQNNELLSAVNSSRPGPIPESQKGNTSSKDGWQMRKEKQNNRDRASLGHKTNKNASPASLQNSISDSCGPGDVTKSQMHPSVMKNQKHSAESVTKSVDTSRKYNSKHPPAVTDQRKDKPFRNTNDGRGYGGKVNNPDYNRKENRDEKYYAQKNDGNKQMGSAVEKQKNTDKSNQPDSAKNDEEKLTKEFLLSLKENKIKYLPKKNPRFPKANYYCILCDFHLNIEADCSKHLTDTRHLRKKKLHEDDIVLRSLPKPTERQFAALTAAVEKVYTELGISAEEKKQRADAVLRLEKVLKEKIPDLMLYMYGSSLTGFGMKTADVNVNLTSTDKNKKLTTLLKETYIGIKDLTDSGFSNVRPDFTAKVPGLYLTDDMTGLTLRIAIHCYKAHCTSQLLSMYSDFDTRVSKLAVAFRYWAHLCGLDRHLDGYMPPQAFNLMVIYFLQQMSPQLVPIIKPPEVTGEETGDYKKDSPAFEKMKAKVMKFTAQTRNNMSVGELWFRLLRFYCLELDTANTVVSIRTDQQVPRNTKPWNSKKLAVEDPYMLKKNVTGMVNQAYVCEYWEDCIRRALHYFGFPRDAEGRSHIPIDAFMKMIQHNEATEACREEDKAVQQSTIGDGSGRTNKTDGTQKTQYSNNSQQQTLTKDDQSSSDSGNDDISHSDTENSDDDVTEDQHENLQEQSSDISAGSKSQIKSAASKHGNHSKPAMLLEDQSLKKDISDSGISDGLSQTPDNGYIPRQAHGNNKSFEVHQHQVMREASVCSSPNDSKDTVITSQTDSSSAASKPLSLSSLGIPAEEDHLKLTEAMNDIFLLLEQRDCYYVFSKEVLTDGKGPVLFCAYCEKPGHLKNACPDDRLPEIFPLPPLTALHVKVLSETLCRLPGLVGLSSFGSSSRFSFLKDLEAFIRTHFDDANLTLFGSSCNGFGFEKSDMDICLTFSQRKIIDKPWVIESLARKMKQSKDLIRVQAISTAKVPIVKFAVRSLGGLEGDISLYNILAQHNTRLLLCYSQIDPRVQILGYAIKHFAKVCDIGDASRGSLSSYAYILMMIYYLQQVSPPVLPVLQELYESKEKPQVMVEECDVWFMDDLKKLNTLWSDKGKNKMSPPELWIGFLRFYVEEFNCKEIVVSIRQKEPVTRFDKLWNGENIAIEDPFDHSHNLGSGLTRNMNNFIFKTFINGRMLHGSPIDNNMELFSKYRNPYDYFFDPELLSESRPPNVRGCHFCGKIGHLARHCSARKANDQQNKQQKQFQQQQIRPLQKQEVLAQELQESYTLLSQQGHQQKQGQTPQLQLKQQASLAQSMPQEKQLIDPKQPNLPSQERPKIQQLQQQPSRYSQQGETVETKQRETKEFPQQQQQEHYNKPLEKQQTQKQILQPHQEERKQNQPLQQQPLQTKQHQTSQSSQLRQQKQPLPQQPLHSVQLQEEHQQGQSSQQKQPSMTQQQLEHLSRQPSQTNQQNMQPIQPQQQQQRQPPHQQQQQQQRQLPQEPQQQQRQPTHQQQQQQRQPPHQQQQITQSLQPQQQLRQPFVPRQQHHRPSEQQFRPPYQHQIRHAMPLQQEKPAFQFQQQPSQMPMEQQNQHRQQHPQSQQQHPHLQQQHPHSQQQHPQSHPQQQYHHSQLQSYHQQQLQQSAKVETYNSKQEQNQPQRNRTAKANPSPEPAPAFSNANHPGQQAPLSVMHSKVYHNSNYMQQRHHPQQNPHHPQQNPHQLRGYTHNNPVLLAPATVAQPQMLPPPSCNFNVFGNRPLLVHPNVMLQPGYPGPVQTSHNPGSGYLTQAPANRYLSHASHSPGNGYSSQAPYSPREGYFTPASHGPEDGYHHNTVYNKGPQTAAGMQHSGYSGGDGSLNGQFMSQAVQNMFDSAREQ